MRTRRIIVVLSIIAALILSGAVAWLYLGQQTPQVAVAETTTAVNLGFSYLNITPKLSAGYRLSADSGVLVTEVAPGSPAERAGIKPGDIIRSFNSIRVQEGTPLFGMMRQCQAGNQMIFEVITGENSRFIELMHITTK